MVLQTNQTSYGTTQYGAAKTFDRKVVRTQAAEFYDSSTTQDYLQLIRNRINEMYDKVENNETEESFQIGANSFSQSQWDRLLSEFDDIQETIRKLMREEFQKRQEHTIEKERLEDDMVSDALVSESVICEYPSSDSESEKVLHVVWYNEYGIYCKKMGEETLEWAIGFDNIEQYQLVHAFMKRFDSDDNLRFAPNQNFWQDFLTGAFNVEEFMTFFEETDNGVPNYLVEHDGSMFVDKEKVRWAPYMNEPGIITMYTVEQMGLQRTLDRNAMLSICHVPTGETANVYRGNEYSEVNPVYKVMGIDVNGNGYVQEINANYINPNNCSYVEMLVWSVHSGKNSPADYITLSRLRSEAKDESYHTQTDYLAIIYKLFEEMKLIGTQEDILHYEKWLEKLVK